MTDVWACPSGIATARRPTGLRFRHALLGTVAAGALSLVSVAPALASFPPGCTVDVTGMQTFREFHDPERAAPGQLVRWP